MSSKVLCTQRALGAHPKKDFMIIRVSHAIQEVPVIGDGVAKSFLSIGESGCGFLTAMWLFAEVIIYPRPLGVDLESGSPVRIDRNYQMLLSGSFQGSGIQEVVGMSQGL